MIKVEKMLSELVKLLFHRTVYRVQIRTRYGEGVVSDIGDVTRPNLRYDRKPSVRHRSLDQ